MENEHFYNLHSDLCKTISHPKRQYILNILRSNELTVNELVAKTGISQSNLSQHLALLRNRGVLTARQEGIKVHYSIANPKILQAIDLMSEALREILSSQNQTLRPTPDPQDEKKETLGWKN